MQVKFCSYECYWASKRKDTPKEVKKEQSRLSAQRWRERHPERAKEVQVRWKTSHPERVKELDHYHSRNRRARLMNRDGSVTPEEWFSLCQKYEFHCLRCGKEFPFDKLTFDHVLPLVKGGMHSIENAQPLCFNCNCKKKEKHIDYRPNWR